MLPTWRYQIFRAICFVDTMWQNFEVYPTNISCLEFMKSRMDEELKNRTFDIPTYTERNAYIFREFEI